MRRLGRVGRPTVAASTVSARCVCQRCGSSTRPESERPRPRLQRHAPRLDVIEYRGVPRSPRGHKNPRSSRLAVCSLSLHRIRCGSSCHRRGVCPRDIAVIAIRHWIAPFGAHVGFSRPRCLWQPCGGGTIPPRHESLTSFSVSTTLAATGRKAACAACHYPFRTHPHPRRGRGAVTGGSRAGPPPRARVGRATRVAHQRRPRARAGGPRGSQGGTLFRAIGGGAG